MKRWKKTKEESVSVETIESNAFYAEDGSLTGPREIIIKNVNCIETEIVDGKAVDKQDAENYKEEANTVVFAIGLKPDKNLLQNQGIELDDWGYVKVDENGKTNLENVYAGGDSTESKATVCRALAAGKKGANGIVKNLI